MIQSKLIYTQIGKKTWSGKWAVAFVGEGPERLPYSTAVPGILNGQFIKKP